MATVCFRSLLVRQCLRERRRWWRLTGAATAQPLFSIRCQSTLPSLRSAVPEGDCPGCGAPFQVKEATAPGYYRAPSSQKDSGRKIQKNSLTQEEFEQRMAGLEEPIRAMLEVEKAPTTWTKQPTRVICHRCHRLTHHHQNLSGPQFLKASQQYGSLEFLRTKQDPVVVAVCDVTDLPGSLADLPKRLGQHPGARVHLVANKWDRLPKAAQRHEQRIRDWLLHHLKTLGWPTSQIRSVSLVSAYKGWGIQSAMDRWQRELRPTDDLYVVGCTNVGKSALVNRCLSQIRGRLDAEGKRIKQELKKKYQITSSVLPGTTLGTIKIPLRVLGLASEPTQAAYRLTKERYLIDTPGLINPHQIFHQLTAEAIKQLPTAQPIHPVTFQLEPGKSLILKPWIRIDLLTASAPVLCTVLSALTPHRTSTDKLPPAIALEYKMHSRPLKDPTVLRLDALVPLQDTVRVDHDHQAHAGVDLSFAGAGWIALAGRFQEARFRIWLPKGLDPKAAFHLRSPAMLPYEFRGSIRKFFGSGERAGQ
ncbi:hypothetical protein BY458DRAFT_584052 [Sporodiniella umbellata]|nr:hypothetical protein BY458DRAFT_584052 [Sporodiniella umbellata]